MGELTPQPTTTCTRLGFSNWFGNYAGPFAYNGVLYAVLVNSGCLSNNWDGVGGGVPAVKTYARVLKSANNGTTWTGPVDDANSRQLPPYNNAASGGPTTDGYQSVQCVQDGSTLYVGRPVWDYTNYLTSAAHRLVISRFDLATETWMADLTGYGTANAPEFNTIQGLGTTAQTFQLLRRAGDGAFIALYNQNVVIPGSWRFINRGPTVGYDHVYYSVWDGVSWSAPTLMAGGPADATDYYPQAANWGDGDTLHVVMQQRTGDAGSDSAPYTGRIWARSLDSAGVLGTLQNPVTVAPAATFSSIDNYWVGNMAALTVAGSTELLVPYMAQPGASFFTRELHVIRAVSAANPAWTDETVSTDFNSFSGSGVGSYWAVADPVAEQFSVLTTDRIQENAIQFLNSAPGVWDLPVTLFAAANFLMGCVSGAVYQYLGDYYFGLLYTDGPSGAYWADDTFSFPILLGAAPPPPVTDPPGLPPAGGTGNPPFVVCGVNAPPQGPQWELERRRALERLRAAGRAMLIGKGCGPGAVGGMSKPGNGQHPRKRFTR